MKTLYKGFCKLEEIVVMTFLCVITGLVFLSAVARTIKHPLNWAQDVSLLLFAWVVFLGADMALRKADYVNVGMFVNKFPKGLQTFLYYLWNIVIIVFLAILVRYGIPLCLDNAKRLFQTLGISYSWATASVPIGSFFMIVTIVLKLIARTKSKGIKEAA